MTVDKFDAPHDEDTRDDMPWIYRAEMGWSVEDLCKAARELRNNPWGRFSEDERKRIGIAVLDLGAALARKDA